MSLRVAEPMKQNDIERTMRDLVDGEAIVGGSLIRIDGKIIASHYVGIDGTIINLIARDSLSAKRRRRDVFPVLGTLTLSIAKHEKMYLGLASVSEDQYVHVLANPGLSLPAFHKMLLEISNKLRS